MRFDDSNPLGLSAQVSQKLALPAELWSVSRRCYGSESGPIWAGVRGSDTGIWGDNYNL